MSFKKVFVDSDIILDLLLAREPFVNYSRPLLTGNIPALTLYTSALIMANVHYIIQKSAGKKTAKNLIKSISNYLTILAFDSVHVLLAADNDHVDFEDSIQYYIAKQNVCDIIVSRNIKHYKSFDIPVLTAEQFLRTILS